jgi:hypothetical protein
MSTVTASDANSASPGPSSADPGQSYSIETVTSDDTVAEDNNVTPRRRKRPTPENGNKISERKIGINMRSTLIWNMSQSRLKRSRFPRAATSAT